MLKTLKVILSAPAAQSHSPACCWPFKLLSSGSPNSMPRTPRFRDPHGTGPVRFFIDPLPQIATSVSVDLLAELEVMPF